MKHPLLLFSISLIMGILTAHISNSYTFILGVILFSIFIIVILSHKRKNRLIIFFIMLIFYSVGAFEYFYIEKINTEKYIDYSGEQVKVIGFIDSEPDIKGQRVVYTLKTSEIIHLNKIDKVVGKLLFSTLKSDKDSFYEYGEEIEVVGEIAIPKRRTNPGGFDYNRYLAQSGISATIFARKENISLGSKKHANKIIEYGNRIRKNIVKIINQSLPKDQAALLNGMLIGYKKDLSKDIQEAFSDSGLMHTMAVSGAHVSFIIFPLVFSFKRLRIKRIISNSIIIFILLMFISITGFQPSVVRAVIMASLILIGQIVWRESEVYTSMSIAAIILLMYNPFLLFNVGFQLSFVATLSLVMFSKNIKDMLKWKYLPSLAKDVLSMTISAQIGVLPITALYFNKISLISIVTNLIITPMLQIISILGYLMAILGQFSIAFSRIVGYLNCTILTFVLFITKTCAGFNFSAVRIVTPSIIFMILYYFIVWFLLWYKPMKDLKINKRHFSIFAAIIFLYIFSLYIPFGKELEVVFIDVGSGDSAFVRTGNGTTILIDGGGYKNPEEDKNIGDSVIIPFLLNYGVRKVDLVVATHGHEDHIQGLRPVLKEFKVGALIIPDIDCVEELQSLIDICQERGIDINKCSRGDIITIDKKTCFTVINPSKDLNDLQTSLNNSSLVLKLKHIDVDFLFTGDIEKESEDDILESDVDIMCEVLKVAHHGSSTSTTFSFLEKVSPKIAIISVGKNNFGHPSQEVIDRLVCAGCDVYRTDSDGAILVKSNGKKIKVKKTIY